MNKVEIKKLRSHIEGGGSIRSFAIKENVKEWYVAKLCRQHEIKKKRPNLTDDELSWIAAVIDCEGTVTVHAPWNKKTGVRFVQAYIRVNMVGKGVPERLQLLCRGSLIFKDRIDKTGNRKPQWYWNITAGGCRWLLPNIIPFMIEKKDRAEIMMRILSRNTRHITMDSGDLVSSINELRNLNQKGFRAKPVVLNESEFRKSS